MEKYECHCVSIGEQMLHDVYLATDVQALAKELLPVLESIYTAERIKLMSLPSNEAAVFEADARVPRFIEKLRAIVEGK